MKNNSGDRNSGNWNSGHRNSGNWNSGDWNSGHGNSGNRNSGHWNSGHGNSGHGNSGIFNTDEPKMRSFNKEADITLSEFQDSERYISFEILLTKWVELKDMTSKEKSDNPTSETTGGYLKTYEHKEAWSNWWEKNRSEEMIERIKKLPNFDAEIFEEITGIKIDEPQEVVFTMDEVAKKLGVDVKTLKIRK